MDVIDDDNVVIRESEIVQAIESTEIVAEIELNEQKIEEEEEEKKKWKWFTSELIV